MNKIPLSHPSLLLAFFLVFFCLCRPVLAVEECTSLLTDRCETCHYMTRVCDKIAENKGKWSWKRTVRNMVRQGAKLNQEEEDALVACLSEPAPKVRQLCSQNR